MKKSRAILIMPPAESDLDSFKQPSWTILRLPPLGLLSLGSYLHEKGHAAKILDCRELIYTNKTNEYLPIVLQTIEEFKPDFVGINVLTTLFNEALTLSREIKAKYPNLFLVAGGVHPSVEPELTFKQNQYIDAIGIGAGEEICLEILDGQAHADIKGLMLRNQHEKYVPRPPESNIDKYPFPNYDLLNKDFYLEFTTNTINGWGYRGVAALTSRGCPYSCKFCASEWSKPFRYHSPEYVVEMVKYLAKYDVDVIAFWDDSIGSIPERLHKICEGFIQQKLFWPNTKLRWFCCLRANQVNPETLKLIKEAGCFGVHIGVESASDRTLKTINKKSTVEINKKACQMVTEAGLNLVTAFIFGLPGETYIDMKQTLDFLKQVNGNVLGVSSFRPLPGSPFYEQFVQEGVIPRENVDWANLGNFSIPAKYVFSEAPREVLDEFFDIALDVENNKRWCPVHEDILKKYPEIIKNIASQVTVKVARPGRYESSAHKLYLPMSTSAVYNALIANMRVLLPYRFRKSLRKVTRAVSGDKH